MIDALLVLAATAAALWAVTARAFGLPAANGFLVVLFQSGGLFLLGWLAVVLTAALA